MAGRPFHTARKSSLLSRYSVTLGELTLRRQTELALLAAKAETELASRAKSAFMGTMSHELRTPLNAIIGFSDLIQSMGDAGSDRDRRGDYAGQISAAGRQLLGVLSDIMDMSKVESGALTLDIDDYPLDEVIDSGLATVAERVAEKRQTLNRHVPPDLPVLPLDAKRLKQVFVNLLSNAHKFTPEGGTITLNARRNADGGATIVIADTGQGMSAEQIQMALRPFAQVQSHYTRTAEGVGLGLPLAAGIMSQLGGELYLESEPGAGTTAVVTIYPKGAVLASKAKSKTRGGGERQSPRKSAHSAGGTAA